MGPVRSGWKTVFSIAEFAIVPHDRELISPSRSISPLFATVDCFQIKGRGDICTGFGFAAGCALVCAVGVLLFGSAATAVCQIAPTTIAIKMIFVFMIQPAPVFGAGQVGHCTHGTAIANFHLLQACNALHGTHLHRIHDFCAHRNSPDNHHGFTFLEQAFFRESFHGMLNGVLRFNEVKLHHERGNAPTQR